MSWRCAIVVAACVTLASGCAAAPEASVELSAEVSGAVTSGHPAGIWSDRYVSPSAYAHYIEARVHQDQGEVDKALAHLDLALSFDPASSYLRVVMAELHLTLDELDEAHMRVEEALERDPESPWAHEVVAKLAAHEGDWPASVAAARRSVSLDPAFLGGWLALARAAHALENFAEAAEALEVVIAARPADASAVGMLGEVALANGQPEEAAAAFERVVALRAWHHLGYLGLGAAREAMGDDDGARAAYMRCTQRVRRGVAACWLRRIEVALASQGERRVGERVVAEILAAARSGARDPVLGDALARGLAEAGLVEVLDRFVMECVRERPSSKGLFHHLGAARHARGDFEEAIAAYREVPAGSDFFVSSRSAQASALSALGRHREAVRAGRAALAVSPDMVALHLLLAELHVEARQPREARRVLAQAIERLPQQAALHQRLGALSLEAGHGEEALSHLERAAALGADKAEDRVSLAEALLRHGQEPRRAEILLREALSQRPERARWRALLGWSLLKRAEYEEALGVLEAAAKVREDDPEVLLWLGEAQLADGQMSSARESWRRALGLTRDHVLRAQLRRKLAQVPGP